MKSINTFYGLYRHFKGAYYFLQRICKSADAHDPENPSGLVCEYFNVMHPEYGFFTRKFDDWNAIVTDREDNFTGQCHRFERVKELDGDLLKNYSTEHLIRELAGREDSPFQELGIPEISGRVFSSDYCVGETFEPHDDFSGGVNPVAVFDTPKEAFDFLRKHYNTRTKVFKRTFIEQKQVL